MERSSKYLPAWRRSSVQMPAVGCHLPLWPASAVFPASLQKRILIMIAMLLITIICPTAICPIARPCASMPVIATRAKRQAKSLSSCRLHRFQVQQLRPAARSSVLAMMSTRRCSERALADGGTASMRCISVLRPTAPPKGAAPISTIWGGAASIAMSRQFGANLDRPIGAKTRIILKISNPQKHENGDRLKVSNNAQFYLLLSMAYILRHTKLKHLKYRHRSQAAI